MEHISLLSDCVFYLIHNCHLLVQPEVFHKGWNNFSQIFWGDFLHVGEWPARERKQGAHNPGEVTGATEGEIWKDYPASTQTETALSGPASRRQMENVENWWREQWTWLKWGWGGMRSNQRRADLFKCALLKQPARRHFMTYSEEREKERKKEREIAPPRFLAFAIMRMTLRWDSQIGRGAGQTFWQVSW